MPSKLSIAEIIALLPDLMGDEQKIEALVETYSASTKNPSDLIALICGILEAVAPLADKVKADLA